MGSHGSVRSRARSCLHTRLSLTTVPPSSSGLSFRSSYPSLTTPRAALCACSRVAACPPGADGSAGLAREMPRAAPVRGTAPRGRVQVRHARRVEHAQRGPQARGPSFLSSERLRRALQRAGGPRELSGGARRLPSAAPPGSTGGSDGWLAPGGSVVCRTGREATPRPTATVCARVRLP